MKFEIHFEFRESLRKFQDLNFWDATVALPFTKLDNLLGGALSLTLSPLWNPMPSLMPGRLPL
jgi:hypothetical protein